MQDRKLFLNVFWIIFTILKPSLVENCQKLDNAHLYILAKNLVFLISSSNKKWLKVC